MSVVVEQFTRQAASFSRLPGHESATELLLDMAGVRPGQAVLDVACGPGMVTCAAARRSARVTGVDITPAMLDQARALQAKLGLPAIEWREAEATALPFGDASFDAVVTRYSLHHFADPDVALGEIMRVTRPGGCVAIADLVLPVRQGVAYDRMERLRDPSHVRTLTRENLIGAAVGAGLCFLQFADYRFTIDLEGLMRSSFPRAGDAERVRALFEADVGVDAMGLSLVRIDGVVHLTYPVTIVSGTKAA